MSLALPFPSHVHLWALDNRLIYFVVDDRARSELLFDSPDDVVSILRQLEYLFCTTSGCA